MSPKQSDMSPKKYDEAFKRNAVGLIESGHSAASVARDLGVPINRIYAWRDKYGKLVSKHGNAKHNLDNEARLERELAHTKMELDILKKAIAIFTKS